ncbi:hypothetical protein TRVL_07041 [Trypanosoma vivax]|nr:hypothetical protein TRVL_07041 [Trypanosoma vivax]
MSLKMCVASRVASTSEMCEQECHTAAANVLLCKIVGHGDNALHTHTHKHTHCEVRPPIALRGVPKRMLAAWQSTGALNGTLLPVCMSVCICMLPQRRLDRPLASTERSGHAVSCLSWLRTAEGRSVFSLVSSCIAMR